MKINSKNYREAFSVEQKSKNRKYLRIICKNKRLAKLTFNYRHKTYLGYIRNLSYEYIACSINVPFELNFTDFNVIMNVELQDIKCKLSGEIKYFRTLRESITQKQDIFVIQYNNKSNKKNIDMIHDFIDELVDKNKPRKK